MSRAHPPVPSRRASSRATRASASPSGDDRDDDGGNDAAAHAAGATVASVFSVPPPAAPASPSRTDDEAAGRYEELISQVGLERRLLRGPFAGHVWGGRYAITALGGRGAQGTTFLGHDARTDQRVALKLFDLGAARDWKANDLFDREVATLQRLDHPGIPRFVDLLKDDTTGARALVMGFIDGDSLAAAIARDGPLPEKRLWPLIFEAAGVLSAVHAEGVVHRDLKPAHLILRADGRVAIVDFGGVGAFRSEAGSTVVGTFGYMAPEQLYGAQTPATDLYALGATLLYAATGKPPDEQPRRGLAVDVDAAVPFLSPPLRVLLSRLLSPDPQGRPADAAALLRELQGLGKQRSATKQPSSSAAAAPHDEIVDAVWREDDALTALTRGRGALGLVLAWVALLATGGVGRLLLPVVLLVAGLFLSRDERRRLRSVRDVARRQLRGAPAGAQHTGAHRGEGHQVDPHHTGAHRTGAHRLGARETGARETGARETGAHRSATTPGTRPPPRDDRRRR
jgi:hypothetical protein